MGGVKYMFNSILKILPWFIVEKIAKKYCEQTNAYGATGYFVFKNIVLIIRKSK